MTPESLLNPLHHHLAYSLEDPYQHNDETHRCCLDEGLNRLDLLDDRGKREKYFFSSPKNQLPVDK
jgi:hypothetical protein